MSGSFEYEDGSVPECSQKRRRPMPSDPTLYSLASEVLSLRERVRNIEKFLGESKATAAEWNGETDAAPPTGDVLAAADALANTVDGYKGVGPTTWADVLVSLAAFRAVRNATTKKETPDANR